LILEIWFLINQLKNVPQAVQEYYSKPSGSELSTMSICLQFWGLAFHSNSNWCCQHSAGNLTPSWEHICNILYGNMCSSKNRR